MYVMKNSKQVELSDRVRFRCTRCGDCCRHVEGVVVVESLDAYKLAKHLNITIPDFFTDYTEPYYLEDTQYPIFTLKMSKLQKLLRQRKIIRLPYQAYRRGRGICYPYLLYQPCA